MIVRLYDLSAAEFLRLGYRE